MKHTLAISISLLLSALLCEAWACTSLIACGRATADGRPILWKNRDTGATDNFLFRVEKPGCIPYVGLFNGGDSLVLDEAWQGMNDCGFAIMNTVAYNLPAPHDDWQDREGFVMARALEICRTVDDFANLLDTLPRPMGVQTNFGCIDAFGGAAYFECSDSAYVRFNAADSPEGVLIRTNYAFSGAEDRGMGYIRYDNTEQQLADIIKEGTLRPEMLTQGISRSFYHALLDKTGQLPEGDFIVDQDYVPRHSTTASIAIEGVNSPEEAENVRMYAIIGYPPVSEQYVVGLRDIPAQVSPSEDCAHAPASLTSMRLLTQIFPITRGNGQKYIDANFLRLNLLPAVNLK